MEDDRKFLVTVTAFGDDIRSTHSRHGDFFHSGGLEVVHGKRGNFRATEREARTNDGRGIQLTGEGYVSFHMWGLSFHGRTAAETKFLEKTQAPVRPGNRYCNYRIW